MAAELRSITCIVSAGGKKGYNPLKSSQVSAVYIETDRLVSRYCHNINKYRKSSKYLKRIQYVN